MRYLWQVLSHKWFVFLAGFRVGRIPLVRLILHDWSKFSPTEFRTYRYKYTKGGCSKEEWERAWLHHIHRNPHHWNHWLLDGRPIPMPETYVREMVADWLGAGRAYQGSWDIQVWIEQHHHEMLLHPETEALVRTVLSQIRMSWPR